MTTYPTFTIFAAGPGGRCAAALGVAIDRCTTWEDYTLACISTPGFASAATRMSERCSTGERVVLGAVLYAADYADLADELSKHTWNALSYTDTDHRTAIIAALMRMDS